MRILVLGGTRFVGRALVERLVKVKDVELTLFNRGVSGAGLFPEVQRILGDRRKLADIAEFSSESWDCVIDCSGYWPYALGRQLKMQAGRVGRYIFISSGSVYRADRWRSHPLSEVDPVVLPGGGKRPCVDDEEYNVRKVECERLLQSQADLDCVIFRPGLILGRHDYTDRLYYWMHKVFHQRQILVAEGGLSRLSYVLAEDLASAIVRAVRGSSPHIVYNVASFATSISLLIAAAGQIMGRRPELVSAPLSFLEEAGIEERRGLPLWIKGSHFVLDTSRIRCDYGLRFTKMSAALEDLIEFYDRERKWRKPSVAPRALNRCAEKELIKRLDRT